VCGCCISTKKVWVGCNRVGYVNFYLYCVVMSNVGLGGCMDEGAAYGSIHGSCRSKKSWDQGGLVFGGVICICGA